jgi:hypothetical protein
MTPAASCEQPVYSMGRKKPEHSRQRKRCPLKPPQITESFTELSRYLSGNILLLD